ncbi:MAG: flagella basal body P-ring formation protein FlgA [Acidobacteriaceae bacterium]
MSVLSGMVVAPMVARGACGAGNTVRDWGLHLEWVVERNCDHPERPATLVAIPWSAPTTVRAVDPSEVPRKATASAPEVRNGMRVTLVRQDENAAIHLYGTALGEARTGESVAVRARWSGALLHGTVRGPGLVEMEPGRGGR